MKHKLHRKILENNLHLLLINIDNVDNVSFGIFIKAGSRNETKKNNGIAHFLEHMVFKGTKKYSTDYVSNKLDNLGARYNAETSYESTAYYVSGHKNDLHTFIDILSEIYKNPAFNKKDINVERGVIIEEINMYNDDAHDIMNNKIHEEIFYNSALSMPIIGTKDNILKFKREDFINFRNLFYNPERTTVVVAGNFNIKEIEEKITKLFGSIKSQNNDYKYELKPRFEITNDFIIHKKKVAQTNIYITFECENMYSDKVKHYDVISDILSSGQSSRLTNILRTKMGAIYYNYSYSINYSHEGVFIITAGVDNNRIEKAIKLILKELRKLKKNGITIEELNKSKKMRKTSFILGLQTPYSLMHFYANQELNYNINGVPKGIKAKNINEILKEYDEITISNINKTIKELFVKDKLRIFVYGKY
jgi:predicted Zn-dependent peptidase